MARHIERGISLVIWKIAWKGITLLCRLSPARNHCTHGIRMMRENIAALFIILDCALMGVSGRWMCVTVKISDLPMKRVIIQDCTKKRYGGRKTKKTAPSSAPTLSRGKHSRKL